MSKVCYIHPSSSDRASHWVMPAGVFGLVDLIRKKGFEVIGLNYPMELSLNPCFSLKEWLESNLSQYYLVGMHWFVHSKGANEIINTIKQVNPKAKIIVGGISATLFSTCILKKIKNIDYLICGDAEEPLPELLDALDKNMNITDIPNLIYRTGDVLIKSSNKYVLKDFSNIKYATLDFLSHSEYYLKYSYPSFLKEEKSFWLLNGRGCIYDCPGCSGAAGSIYNSNHSVRLLKRNLENVLSDISDLMKLNLNFIKLTHDLSSMGREYYSAFLNQYYKISKTTALYNECWQLPSHEFIDSAIQAGLEGRLELAVTVYSGSIETREKYGKHYSNRELIESIEHCIKGRFTVKLFFSRFLPGETYNSLKATLMLINELNKIKYKTNLIEIFYEPFLADPCSKMTLDRSIEEIFEEYINWDNDPDKKLYAMMTENYTGREIIIDKKIIECIKN